MAGRFFDAWADSLRGCLPDNEEMSPPTRARSSMIVSVSRRTDIPAFYADWFFRRLEEGFALVRNPVNPRRVSRVNLSPDATDGFVFWTKNPSPMLNRLSRLRDYAYYFQVTLNAYGRDAEPGVPSKRDVIIPAFRRLSELAGRERVIWRYDPVFFSAAYTMEHHVRYFERLAALLAPWTEKCIVSFLDVYRNTRRNMASLGLRDASMEERRALASALAEIARSHDLTLEACAEDMDFGECGIGRARCVDAERLGRLRGVTLKAKKDPNQRPACGCAESVDIGAYDSCLHGCRYCYACAGRLGAPAGAGRHEACSPFLVGHGEPGDVVVERAGRTCGDRQLFL